MPYQYDPQGGTVKGDPVVEIIKTALDHGVNFFDNAEIYSNGESEKEMRRAFKELDVDRSQLVVSTKIFFGTGKSDPNQKLSSRKHIIEGIDSLADDLKAGARMGSAISLTPDVSPGQSPTLSTVHLSSSSSSSSSRFLPSQQQPPFHQRAATTSSSSSSSTRPRSSSSIPRYSFATCDACGMSRSGVTPSAFSPSSPPSISSTSPLFLNSFLFRLGLL
ncbi:hypothetical protein JCM16303_000653 [Sporobolomyces ruberrimus]